MRINPAMMLEIVGFGEKQAKLIADHILELAKLIIDYILELAN